jgi:amphi-Trp domain-containing protein
MSDEAELKTTYLGKEVVAELRRLADALEQGTKFEMQIGEERISIPPDVEVEFDYEGTEDEEEVEIELKWKRKE